ncbi:hypothetical protein NEHOM01_2239 [Nematocida homosporus]|uniref:uncharacterized protein n=1 Tax=Nematocida homosporus TaxID=1912981 RepID=UPI00221FA9C4|nr:uncharacterized protein NEHOM01_2239 [Nematocida homosporus]KAI5187518.1 hypothetical protein NEHOM01_2239 [Nematocida homosporus]
MTLSLRMKTLSGACTQNKPRGSLLCASNYKHVPSTSHSTRTTPLRTNAYTTKLSHYRVMISNWTAIRLCVLLVLLHWTSIVSGSSMEIDQLVLPSSEEILKSLKDVGLEWARCDAAYISAILYPPQESTESTSGTDANTNTDSPQQNSTQKPTPRYVIDCSNKSIRFKPGRKCNLGKECLNVLKWVRVIKARKVLIKYARGTRMYYQEGQACLCRLINIFECKEMEFLAKYSESTDPYPDEFDLDLCRKEAKDAIKYVNLAPLNLRVETNIPSSIFLKYIFERIVILHPISHLTLYTNMIPDLTAYFVPLLMLDNYYFTIRYLTPKVYVDLERLIKQLPPKCVQITIDLHENIEPIVSGLENLPKEDITIALIGKLDCIDYLVDYNPRPIRVHILSNNEQPKDQTYMLNYSQEDQSFSEPRIHADKLVYTILATHPCDFLFYYKRILTPEFFVQHGIIVNDVQTVYADDRMDFRVELDNLCKIGGLSKIPTDLEEKKIECLGHALSEPGWRLEDAVNIKLSAFDRNSVFCQHICYTTLSISGDTNPTQQDPPRPQIDICSKLLDGLRSVNAQELRISNVRDYPPTDINIDMAKLKLRLANPRKYNLNVKTLILDNVDECILYRMLGCYEFTCSDKTEIHLLNQRFTSLAFAQILALPMTERISKLVIEGAARLNELKHFHQRKELDGFSLFNYLEERKEKKETEELDLHKLVLIPEPILFDSYNISLQALKDLGVQITTPPNEYITDPSFLHQPHMIDMKSFTYCTATLDALKNDLATYQSALSIQSDQIPAQPNPTTDLFLRISGAQVLTKADLNTIICWVGCRLQNLTTLWLANFELTEEDRTTLSSCEYMAKSPPYLQLIQIEDTTPGKDPIELSLHLYHNNLQAIKADSEHDFVAVPYKLLSRLYTYCDKIEDHISGYNDSNLSFQIIIKVLKKEKLLGDVPECQGCNKTLYMPSEETKRERPDTNKPRRQFNPKTNFHILCYVKCGGTFCIHCAKSMPYRHLRQCDMCTYRKPAATSKRLISIPSSICIFPDISDTATTIDSAWSQITRPNDSHNYFYLVYNDRKLLINDINKEQLDHIHLSLHTRFE